MMGIDHNADLVAGRPDVSAAQHAHNALRAGIKCPYVDVQEPIIVQDAGLRFEPRLAIFLRVGHAERINDRRLRPCRLVHLELTFPVGLEDLKTLLDGRSGVRDAIVGRVERPWL